MMNRSPLRIHLLGRFQVSLEQQLIPQTAWRLRSAAALVKLLALAPDYHVHREQLMDTLWPEAEPEASANNLRYSLHSARRILATGANAGDFLKREGSLLALGPPELVWTDVRAFEDAVAEAWQGAEPAPFQHAAALYVGDLLPEDLYEDWTSDRRTALRASHLALLARLAEVHEQRGELEQAISTLQDLLTCDPTQEEVHVQLMRLHARSGRRRLALEQYERLTEILALELDVTPDTAARELFAAIRNGSFPADEVSTPGTVEIEQAPAPAPALVPSRVPSPLDELIDRRRELAEVSQLLATKRLVTLTGPGGIGKTRLAIAIAQALQDALPDGAVFVSLASARNPGMIVPRVAQTLGLREQRGQPPEELVEFYLHNKRLLLVLDNCEHVVAGAPLLAELLKRCPQVRVLATSRTRLGLAGEQEYPVGPLPYPDPSNNLEASTLPSFPAVALFVRRAREVQSDFAVSADNAMAVAEICSRLHGLPLAIGLAAARSKILTPQMMLARLDRPLELLTGGPRDAPERQQTMRNTIRWSYDLLERDEQRLLHALSIFAGGWTLEAAEAVAEYDDVPISVLDGLTSLVNNSLVIQERAPGSEPRFSMLEPVREFGLELLTAEGQAEVLHLRHAWYFATLAEPTPLHLEGPEPYVWLNQLEAEHENLRAALRWAIAAGQGELAQRLAGSIWEFWAVRGYHTEGRRWLALALAADAGASVARAEALRGSGELSWRHGEYDVAAELLHESLALYRRLDADVGIARTLNSLGLLEMARGRFSESKAHLEASLEQAERIGDLRCISRAMHNLGGNAIRRGDYEAARQMLEATVELARRIENQRNLAYALSNLGVLALDQDDFEQSRIWLEESLSLFQRDGDRAQVAQLICHLGQWAFAVGDLRLARQKLGESLTLCRELGIRLIIANVLRLLGQVALASDESRRAARLFGAAELLREQVSWNRSSLSAREAYEASLTHLMTMLDGEVLAAAWAEGRGMSMNDAISYALADESRAQPDSLSFA